QLVVEDEQVCGKTVRRERLALVQRVAAHLEVASEDLVHRQERRGHASGSRHELPATHAELLGGCVGELVRADLDPLLLLGLWCGHPFAVRYDLSGNWGGEGFDRVSPGAPRQLRVTEPRIVPKITVRHI